MKIRNSYSLHREFETMAIKVLEECRREDELGAQKLVVKDLPDFGQRHLTNLEIAISADDKDFVSRPTCQIVLSKLWMGGMSIDTPKYKVCFNDPML